MKGAPMLTKLFHALRFPDTSCPALGAP
jgi:hypothetical protein